MEDPEVIRIPDPMTPIRDDNGEIIGVWWPQTLTKEEFLKRYPRENTEDQQSDGRKQNT